MQRKPMKRVAISKPATKKVVQPPPAQPLQPAMCVATNQYGQKCNQAYHPYGHHTFTEPATPAKVAPPFGTSIPRAPYNVTDSDTEYVFALDADSEESQWLAWYPEMCKAIDAGHLNFFLPQITALCMAKMQDITGVSVLANSGPAPTAAAPLVRLRNGVYGDSDGFVKGVTAKRYLNLDDKVHVTVGNIVNAPARIIAVARSKATMKWEGDPMLYVPSGVRQRRLAWMKVDGVVVTNLATIGVDLAYRP